MGNINIEDMTFTAPMPGAGRIHKRWEGPTSYSVHRFNYMRPPAWKRENGWNINKMWIDILDPQESRMGISLDAGRALSISCDSYRTFRHSAQPDLRSSLRFNELIAITPEQEAELKEIFTHATESRIPGEYDSPGRYAYICPPVTRKKARVHYHPHGKIVPREDLDEMLATMEQENDFVARIFVRHAYGRPAHVQDTRGVIEIKTDNAHTSTRELKREDIERARRGTGIKVVTNTAVAKPGDFLFVFEHEGQYAFAHCGMFDFFGKPIEAGMATVQNLFERYQEDPDAFIRIYDGLATDVAAAKRDTWQQEFAGASREEIARKLDRRFGARTGFSYAGQDNGWATTLTVPIVSMLPMAVDRLYLPGSNRTIRPFEFERTMRHFH